MAKIIAERFPGLLLIEGKNFEDHRGQIVKLISRENLPGFVADEAYYTISRKNVLRGLHFQLPPFEQKKLIYVAKGKILDVVLDLRKSSPTYGKFETFSLEGGDNRALLIPPGVAHGNYTIEDDSFIHYVQSGHYSPEHERGIHFDSFGMQWPVDNPIVSEKDRKLPFWDEFRSPF